MITRPSIIRPYPTGACAPSDDALKAVSPLVLDDKLEIEYLDKPEREDLLEKQGYGDWPAPIQGQRQTCVAFAAAACVELLRARYKKPFQALSPQFLYWYMRALGSAYKAPEDLPPGWDRGATKLGQAKDVLIVKGVCAWSECPYMDRLPPGDQSLVGPRPDAAANDAAAANRIASPSVSRIEDADNSTFYFDFPDAGERKPGAARMVYDLLANKRRPVAISIPVFYSKPEPLETNWDNPVTTNSGQVIDPIEEDWMQRDPADTRGAAPGHAVCIVGFQPDERERTGGWFIFRNSRGINWAAHSDPHGAEPPTVPARGYGAISATYVERYCWEIFSPVLS